MSKFPPDELVDIIVLFTRTLYAQLRGQKFAAPHKFRMPPTSSPNYKAYELGMKLVNFDLSFLYFLFFAISCIE